MTSNRMIGVLSLVLCGAALFSISFWADDPGPPDMGHGGGAGAQGSPTPADSGHAMLIAPESRVSGRLATAQDHRSVAPDSVLGQVNITVRTQDGLVVDKGTVVLSLDGKLVQEEHLDAHGECVFSALEPGEYSPVILQDSLEYGLLAPRDQERYEEYLPLYMRGQLTEVRSGQTEEVTLVVSRASRVSGVVTEADGEPVSGVHVRFLSTIVGANHLWAEDLTNENGRYEVELPASRYRSRVFPPKEMRDAGVTRPGPIDFRLVGGEQRTMDFVIGGGPCRITGRVIDQNGQPAADIAVFSYFFQPFEELDEDEAPYTMADGIALVHSGSDGTYSIDGVPDFPIKVHFGYKQYNASTGSPGENRLGNHSKPVFVDLRGMAGTVEVDDGIVILSRPYDVYLSLTKNLRQFLGKEVRPEITIERWEENPNRGVIKRAKWLDDGRLYWWCETPESSMTIAFHKDGSILAQVTVVPYPGGTEHFTVALEDE